MKTDDPRTSVRPGGCVQIYIDGFVTEFQSAGYTLLSTRDYVRSAAHLGRWMDSGGLTLCQLTDNTFKEFAQHRCTCPGTGRHGRIRSARHVRRARRFVDYLRRTGVVAPGRALPPKTVQAPLMGFRAWMLEHRGVTEATISGYEKLIETLLEALGDDPASYDAALVRQVVLKEVGSRSRGYAKSIVTALRAFVRFLVAEGRCRAHLDQAIPTVPQWNLSALPRYLESDDVERVIASCDLDKSHGVRDRAVLLLLARLGLRAGDIVTMRVDDIDWKEGTLRVCGKGRKEVRLPLPQDAGDALLDYLVRVRRSAEMDQVFLCANAPPRPFAGSSTVSCIVQLALQRADITNPPSKGAHLLRHSAATAMLRSGASLDAVAAVLRHKSSDMTAHYAKIDAVLLQQITQPWPEGAPC